MKLKTENSVIIFFKIFAQFDQNGVNGYSAGWIVVPGHLPAVLRMMLLIYTFRPTKIRFRLFSFTACELNMWQDFSLLAIK